ncbi:MAG: amino acid permease, partial [bacterium]
MELKRKYNLFTAIAMVVGIIVGSGVFFKASGVLKQLEGNLTLSILAWVVGGLVMIVSAYTFSLVASNCKKNTDLINMAEETVGRKHAYCLSWYCAVLYYPLLVGVLGWVCANFTAILFGVDSITFVVVASFIYVSIICAFNFVAPKIAGYFQVSTTIIKLIPLVIMAIFGVIYGLFNDGGVLVDNFTNVGFYSGSSGFMGAVCGTCFAYEGWIVATTISKELKDPKKTLPKALVIGTLIVLGIYIAYYIGLAGTYANSDFIDNGDEQVKLAFSKIFGGVGGTILYVFVVISCIGTLNGLAMGAMRNMKSIADTDNGP